MLTTDERQPHGDHPGTAVPATTAAAARPVGPHAARRRLVAPVGRPGRRTARADPRHRGTSRPDHPDHARQGRLGRQPAPSAAVPTARRAAASCGSAGSNPCPPGCSPRPPGPGGPTCSPSRRTPASRPPGPPWTRRPGRQPHPHPCPAGRHHHGRHPGPPASRHPGRHHTGQHPAEHLGMGRRTGRRQIAAGGRIRCELAAVPGS